jgi:Protein of unknown function (DUF559)
VRSASLGDWKPLDAALKAKTASPTGQPPRKAKAPRDSSARPSGFEGLLLASASERARSCSRLWRCATRFVTPEGVRPGPSTPDAAPERAARGGGSCGCVLPNRCCFPAFARTRNWLVRRLGLVVGSSHARGRTRRASPGLTRRNTAGGCHVACAFWAMTRTNNKPSFQSRSKQRVTVIAERAGVMRGSPTATEALLWDRIRGRQLGVLFRRQVPLLGRFIADFYAPARRLVIEVDARITPVASALTHVEMWPLSAPVIASIESKRRSSRAI